MPLEKVERSLIPTQLLDLVLPELPTALQRILDLGIEGAPHEVCGIIVREWEGFRIVQLHNRADDPTDSYRIDSATLRTLALKPETWKHVAVWHTHPGGRVGPSPGDLATKIPEVKYLVVTVPTGEAVWF